MVSVAELLDRASNLSIEQAREAIEAFAADPSGNIPALLITIAIVVLVLLAVLLFVIYIIMPPQRKIVRTRTYRSAEAAANAHQATPDEPARTVGESERRSMRVLSFLGSWVVVSAVILAGFAAVYGLTSTRQYCLDYCHAESPRAIAAAKINHASCRECHEEGGLLGLVANSVSRSRMGAVSLVGVDKPAARPVDESACLRCHREVLTETVETKNGLRLAHAHIYEAGYSCTYCHESIGHKRANYSRRMSPCTECHDGSVASSDCDTCHAVKPGTIAARAGATAQEMSRGTFAYNGVDASTPVCSGCHAVAKECDPCHGIRLPHDDAFIEGGHARQSAFERKQKCWKCHDPATDCVAPCHTGFTRTGINGHPPTWKTEHRITQGEQTCGCHQRYSRRSGPMCVLCH